MRTFLFKTGLFLVAAGVTVVACNRDGDMASSRMSGGTSNTAASNSSQFNAVESCDGGLTPVHVTIYREGATITGLPFVEATPKTPANISNPPTYCKIDCKVRATVKRGDLMIKLRNFNDKVLKEADFVGPAQCKPMLKATNLKEFEATYVKLMITQQDCYPSLTVEDRNNPNYPFYKFTALSPWEYEEKIDQGGKHTNSCSEDPSKSGHSDLEWINECKKANNANHNCRIEPKLDEEAVGGFCCNPSKVKELAGLPQGASAEPANQQAPAPPTPAAGYNSTPEPESNTGPNYN